MIPGDAKIHRILIVDDFEPWRRLIRLILEPIPEFQVIADAETGLEAVSQANDLQPELILMDIDLPRLNGLEAARQIRSLSPNSKILFISEDNTVETAQDAFRVGAVGYIIKSNAGVELLAALQDITAGRRYVSRRLPRHNFFDDE